MYAHGWSAVRRAARVRDEYRCQVCGIEKSQTGRNPDVHHIRPVRSFDDPGKAHRLDNVVSLCRPCHRKVEAGSISLPSPEDG
ncbi:HNH endonuclease [Salinarchaeum chitinilyticum]